MAPARFFFAPDVTQYFGLFVAKVTDRDLRVIDVIGEREKPLGESVVDYDFAAAFASQVVDGIGTTSDGKWLSDG